MKRYQRVRNRQPGTACTTTGNTIAGSITAGRVVLAAAMLGLSMAGTMQGTQPAYSSTTVNGTLFNGVPTVGPLFWADNNKLGGKYCTASVVHSPAGNLLITAAHCVSGRSPSHFVFAPGYHRSIFPHGKWPVTGIYVSQSYARHGNVNDDVAFLTVRSSGRKPLEQQVGSAPLVTAKIKLPVTVTVIGYPDRYERAVTCTAPASPFVKTSSKPPLLQMIFKCGGFYAGTSGGPFLVNTGKRYPHGEIIGVVGGYNKGGRWSNVSYSPQFSADTSQLYQQAIASDHR